MSEPVPCPSCGALLRLPPGQAMVRCPGCKTVLAVEVADAPLSPPPPPPPPTAPVAPLPFGGRRPPVKPVAAAPPAKPIPAAAKEKQGPKNPFDAPSEEDLAAKDAARKKQIRRELAEMAEEKLQENRKYDVLLVDCRHGRTALQFLAHGALSSGVASIFFFLFLTGSAILVAVVPLLLLACIGMIAHWVLTLIGFGYGLVGPKQARGLCIVGLVSTVLNAIMTAFVAIVILANIVTSEMGLSSGSSKSFAIEAMLLGNAFSNISCLTDIPVYLLTGGVREWPLYVFPMIGAAFEFAKLSALSLYTHRVCTLGKEHELAHAGMRFVYRSFGVVLVIMFLKLVNWLNFILITGDPLPLLWFAIMTVLAINGYFLWSAFAWYSLYQTQKDAVDIVEASRFVDKRDRLDMV